MNKIMKLTHKKQSITEKLDIELDKSNNLINCTFCSHITINSEPKLSGWERLEGSRTLSALYELRNNVWHLLLSGEQEESNIKKMTEFLNRNETKTKENKEITS